MLDAYIPKLDIAAWATAFACVQFENQRWIKSRMGGLQGASQWFGLFIDLTGGLAMVFGFTVLALNWYDSGWRSTLGLAIITTVLGFIWAYLGGYVERVVGTAAVWLVSTALLYVFGAVLAAKFSWFGAF